MKVCWDNLENVKLTRYGNFVKSNKSGERIGRYEYRESCKYCGEPFLTCVKFGKEKSSIYCSSYCCNNDTKQFGRANGRYNHGTYMDNGYVYKSFNGERKRIHTIIAKDILGRPLKRNEVVHHINLDKLDNRNSNLMICTRSYHQWLHTRMAKAWVEGVGL